MIRGLPFLVLVACAEPLEEGFEASLTRGYSCGPDYVVLSDGSETVKLRALFAGKNVIMQKPAVHLVDDGFFDLRRAMPGICDQNTGTPIEPAIAIFIINKNVIGFFPNDGRLAAHGNRLELPQLFQRWQ